MPTSWRAHSRGMELWIDGVMDGWGNQKAVRMRREQSLHSSGADSLGGRRARALFE